MKTLILLSLTTLVVSIAVPSFDWQSAPQGERILPRLDSSNSIDGAKRKEILYGPFTIPPGQMLRSGNMNGDSPCENCFVTAMQATLKYLNGTEALTSDGVWLHHTILSHPSSPTSPSIGATIWAAGNERPTIRLNTDNLRYGIDFPSRLIYTVDIMSEQSEPFDLSLSITYEYIDKDSEMGKNYRGTSMHWSLIGYPMPKDEKANYNSIPWTSDVDGRLLYATAHMHDGGTHQLLFSNGELICNSTMFYGRRAGYDIMQTKPATTPSTAKTLPTPLHDIVLARPSISPPEVFDFTDDEDSFLAWLSGWFNKHKRSVLPAPQHSPDLATKNAFGGAHISDPGACTNFASIKKGDVITSQAFYDLKLHPAMSHEGRQQELMGNMRIYIGPT